MGKEVPIASERIYEGRFLGFRADNVRLSEGKVTRREVVEHKGSVAIVALDRTKGLLLLRRYKGPMGEGEELYRFSLAQALKAIDRGEIEDGKTIIGLLILWACGDNVLSHKRREQV